MKQAYLIIDIGTGNSKVGVITEDGSILATARRNSVYYENHLYKSSIYFKPDEWISSLEEMIYEVLQKTRGQVRITAVSASSQRQGIVMIGKKGESLLGCPNSDMRGAEFIDQLDWDTLFQINGLAKDGFYSCFKILGTMKREPELASRIETYTSISDWVGYLWTGNVVWERSQTAHTEAYNIRKDCWDPDMCRIIGINIEQLPPIVAAGTVLGRIKPELAEKFGLSEDVIFVTGAADTQTAIVGTAAEKGEIIAVNGTTTPMTTIVDEYRPVSPCWLSPHSVSGEYMLEVNCGGTGLNLQYFKNSLMKDKSYEELERAAFQKGLPVGLIAMFSEEYQIPRELSLLVGFIYDEGVSMSLEPCDYYYAMVLDTAFQMARNYNYLDSVQPSDRDYIVGCGGGFKGFLTAQALADISGKEVLLPEGYDQGTMYGCMYYCNKALERPVVKRRVQKIFSPHENEAIENYYQRWLMIRDKLKTG